MGAEPVRRPREPRRGRGSCKRAQRARARARAGRRSRPPRSRRRGPACRGRRTSAGSASASSGTWAGCTTRSAYFAARPDLPALPPPPADVLAHVRVQRELRPAAVARRGRARQGLAARTRCPATAGRSSRTCARSTRTCGRTPARSCCSWAASSRQDARVEPRRARSTGTCSSTREHAGVQALVRDLNRVYRDASRRSGRSTSRTRASAGSRPTTRRQRARVRAAGRGTASGRSSASATSRRCRATSYRVGMPRPAAGSRRSTRDSAYYGGSDVGNLGGIEAEAVPWHDQPYSAELTLPPLGVVWLVPE